MQVVHSPIKQLYVLVIDNSSVQELTKQISGDNNFYNFAPRVFRGIKALFPIYGAKTLFLDKHLLCTEQQATTRILVMLLTSMIKDKKLDNGKKISSVLLSICFPSQS